MEAPVIVQASCPFCGPVALPAQAFSCGFDPRMAERGLCQFSCPFCARPVFLGTARDAAAVLIAGGARSFAGRAPFELLETHRGGPLSWDDLLDFHLAIRAAPCPQEEVVRLGDRSTM